jgi:hypothetical protein
MMRRAGNMWALNVAEFNLTGPRSSGRRFLVLLLKIEGHFGKDEGKDLNGRTFRRIRVGEIVNVDYFDRSASVDVEII